MKILRCQVALFCPSTNLILYYCKPSQFAGVTFLENHAKAETMMLELKPYGEKYWVTGTTNARNTKMCKSTVNKHKKNMLVFIVVASTLLDGSCQFVLKDMERMAGGKQTT